MGLLDYLTNATRGGLLDTNAMPSSSWRTNPVITQFGASMLGGGGMQDFANKLPATQLIAGSQMEKARRQAAWNVALKAIEAGKPIPPEVAALLPEVGAAMVSKSLETPEQTTLYKNAIAAGLKEGTPEFADFIIKGSMPASVNVNTDPNQPKLPSNYMPIDPNDLSKGVQPIPGGPATTVPSELAARLGLAKRFINETLPKIKDDISAGKATGPADYVFGQIGWGRSGEIRRRIQDGTDAMRRMLTGQGMPASEAANYVSRFEPAATDDAKILTDKIGELEGDLKAIIASAEQGRAWIPPNDNTPGAPIKPSAAAGTGVMSAEDWLKQ